MKPKPLSSLNHLTVPVAIAFPPASIVLRTRRLLSKSYDRWHCDVGRITRPDLATVAVSRQGLARRPARLARGGGSCRRLRGAAVPHKEARPDGQGACRRRHGGEKADLLLAALTTSSVLFSGEGQLVFVVANPDVVVAVATQRRPVEPLIRTPEPVEPACVGRVGVIHVAV